MSPASKLDDYVSPVRQAVASFNESSDDKVRAQHLNMAALHSARLLTAVRKLVDESGERSRIADWDRCDSLEDAIAIIVRAASRVGKAGLDLQGESARAVAMADELATELEKIIARHTPPIAKFSIRKLTTNL